MCINIQHNLCYYNIHIKLKTVFGWFKYLLVMKKFEKPIK